MEHEIDYKNSGFYLSGPMTGHELNNVREFAATHAMLHVLGAHRVHDPAYSWLLMHPDKDKEMRHEDYMIRSYRELCGDSLGGGRRYDYVVMLPGWEYSAGATAEHEAAMNCGIQVVEAVEVAYDFARMQEGLL